MGTTRINILGEDFVIKTDKDSEYVERVFAVYKKKVSELQDTNKKQSELRIAILAGLLVAEESLQKNTDNTQNIDQKRIESITQSITKMLDTVIS